MKETKPLDLSNVFFEALEYPEYARTNFFINKQKLSDWSKSVYLTALDEVYHNCIEHLYVEFNASKIGAAAIKIEDIKIPIKELCEIEIDIQIDKIILDQLHYAVQSAWYLDVQPKAFSTYQVISFVETALFFIRKEFEEQSNETKDFLPRPRTKTYFTYSISQDAPFFDFLVFRNVTRELLFTSQNLKKVTELLTSFHRVAIEIVDLWNDKIYEIVKQANSFENPEPPTKVRVNFYSDTLKHHWVVNEKLFDNLPHEPYTNESFAAFAANIANLINREIIHGEETKINKEEKNFLKDFLQGIKILSDLNDSEQAIKNIIAGNRWEGPFRDYFFVCFRSKDYSTNREPLRGNNRMDLRVEHQSMSRKIIEFKGWWHKKKGSIVKQLFNYLTQFEGEGYIFMIDDSETDITGEYMEMIMNKGNGYIDKSWEQLTNLPDSFNYFRSQHKLRGQSKVIYHFIFEVRKPEKIH